VAMVIMAALIAQALRPVIPKSTPKIGGKGIRPGSALARGERHADQGSAAEQQIDTDQ
jgi:hypothetical protein